MALPERAHVDGTRAVGRGAHALTDASCPDCGAEGIPDRESCERLFRQVIAREFSQPELFHVHGLTVDAYSLQHPDKYMKSRKSAAAHLAGMCWQLEHGGGPMVSRGVSRWLNGSPNLPRVVAPPPRERGEVTVLHVFREAGGPAHPDRVREWATEAWRAWAHAHEQARAWVREALET